jgi:hypothetical protein
MTDKIKGYFQFDDEQFSIAIVLKEFWNENKCLDDSGSEQAFLPKRFYQQTEAIYEHDFDNHEEAVKALNNAGFFEKELF